MQPEPVIGAEPPMQPGRFVRTTARVLSMKRPSASSGGGRCDTDPATRSALLAAATEYIAQAHRILELSGAPSVNVALEHDQTGHHLEAAHQRLVELVGVDGGDYMFVLVEQLSGVKIERPLRLTHYPVGTTSSVWFAPLQQARPS